MNANDRCQFLAELERLAVQGLNWVAYLPASLGPATVGIGTHQGLLLLLSLGRDFGDQTVFAGRAAEDPFDRRAQALAQDWITRRLQHDDPDARLLYPQSTAPIDLRAWLQQARVQYPSRLGIGIRPDCGPWFAVRAAVTLALSAAHQEALLHRYPPLPDAPSPCDACADTPCVAACPALAIDVPDHLQRCSTHRLQRDSTCSHLCLARLSCPVGREHQYPPPQMSYHYGVSLTMLRRWKSSAG